MKNKRNCEMIQNFYLSNRCHSEKVQRQIEFPKRDIDRTTEMLTISGNELFLSGESFCLKTKVRVV